MTLAENHDTIILFEQCGHGVGPATPALLASGIDTHRGFSGYPLPCPSLRLWHGASATGVDGTRRAGRCDEKHLIVNPTLPSRRVWASDDNEWYRNRQILLTWMDEMDHVDVRIPVDKYKWPVPALFVPS